MRVRAFLLLPLAALLLCKARRQQALAAGLGEWQVSEANAAKSCSILTHASATIAVQDKVPGTLADIMHKIKVARAAANKADVDDDFELEERLRARIRKLKQLKTRLASDEDQPVMYTDETEQWKAMKLWTPQFLTQKYPTTLLSVRNSLALELSGKTWDEIGLAEYIVYQMRDQQLSDADGYEQELLNSHADSEKREEVEVTSSGASEHSKIGRQAQQIFFDYDTDTVEALMPDTKPEPEWVSGSLGEVAGELFGDEAFEASLLAKPARSKTSRFEIFAPGSGKTFNQSLAHWIVIVAGEKRVLFYPPTTLPPDIYPAPDTIHEWLDHVYPRVKGTAFAPMEVSLKRGDVLYVPEGWHFAEINCQEGMSLLIRAPGAPDSAQMIIEEASSVFATKIANLRRQMLEAATSTQENADTQDQLQQGLPLSTSSQQQQRSQLPADPRQGGQSYDTAMQRHDVDELDKLAKAGARMLEKLVERVDNRCDVYMRLSTFQSLANEHDDACANAQRAIDLCPDHISPRMSLAAAISNRISSVQTHQQQGDAKILREDFEKMKEGAQKIGQIIEYVVKRNSVARWRLGSEFERIYAALQTAKYWIGDKNLTALLPGVGNMSVDVSDPYGIEYRTLVQPDKTAA